MVMEKPKSVAAYFKKLPHPSRTLPSGRASHSQTLANATWKGVPDRWRVYRALAVSPAAARTLRRLERASHERLDLTLAHP